LIIVAGTTVALAVRFLSSLWFGVTIKDAFHQLGGKELVDVLKSLSIGGFVATLMFFFMLWQDAMKSAFRAREKMLVYQSETLKNQVNPHFLFNSLNTLSSLIPVDPEKAEAFTYKLSAIYRYILENREVELVPLEQEIGFVRDYYFLQKIRDEEKIDLTISIENPKCLILPISLQLLVENAFKHNVATLERPLNVLIAQNGDWVEVKNNLQRKTQLGGPSGLGLKNLSERVKIHTGRSLEIREETDQFVVRMPLICKK
jgi:two-component system, LytTR family, sensor kinase